MLELEVEMYSCGDGEPESALDPKAQRTLQLVFQAFSPELRALLWLHVVEGEPIGNVAVTLGIPVAEAHKIHRSGVQALKAFLGQRCGSHDLLQRHLRALPTPEPTPVPLPEIFAL